MKTAIYHVEVLAEQPFEAMDFEFAVELNDDEDETNILNPSIYKAVMDQLSINPEFLYLEEDECE